MRKLVELLKKPVRKMRQARRSQELKKEKDLVGKERIVADLKKLGLAKKQTVIVHSSLKSIGFVDGGPDTVIDALLEIVGEEGTILMPAYPMNKSMYRYLSEDPVFDPTSARSTLGAITEVFRQRSGVLRSLHPTHSISAFGPNAEYLVKDHEKSETPCGPNSPFAKLIELDGLILSIGCGIGKVTSYHVAEDVIERFPYPVYLKEKMRARYLDSNGHEKTTEIKVHDPVYSKRRIDNQPVKEAEILALLKKEGILNESMVGNAASQLMSAKGLEEFLEREVHNGVTIYMSEEDLPKKGEQETA